MAGTTVSQLKSDGILERRKKFSSKVKTGCVTCRIRRVKCDEAKPACQKCIKTGRACDGYMSIFRPVKNTLASASTLTISFSAPPALLFQPNLSNVTTYDVSMLSRYLTPKVLSRLDVGYETEAQEALRASVSEPAIRHAIISLRYLRQSFEQVGEFSPTGIQGTPSFYYGLQQYNKAVASLARKLSEEHSNCLRSTLLCCQLFISIELTQKHYASAAQHFIRGFKIMYDYHTRPAFDDEGNLIRVEHRHLPHIDIFALKLFIPSCRRSFEMPNISFHNPGLTDTIRQYRIELVSLAESTLRLLDKISRITSIEDGLDLLNEKKDLLNRVQAWYMNFQKLLTRIEVPNTNSSRSSFIFLFHSTLKIVITLALEYSQEITDSLNSEFDNMTMIAQNLTEVYGQSAV